MMLVLFIYLRLTGIKASNLNDPQMLYKKNYALHFRHFVLSVLSSLSKHDILKAFN